MNPLWIVDVTYVVGIPVVAATEREAEDIAIEVAGDYIKDERGDAVASRINKTELRFYAKEYPFGMPDDEDSYTCQEYYNKYQTWVQEEARKKELEERQGKLF